MNERSVSPEDQRFIEEMNQRAIEICILMGICTGCGEEEEKCNCDDSLKPIYEG